MIYDEDFIYRILKRFYKYEKDHLRNEWEKGIHYRTKFILNLLVQNKRAINRNKYRKKKS